MRLKKGFTLAEILIVLMVIGVIATMTIPSMMKGVTEAQLKAGYKKAYNTVSNFAAMEKVSGSLPARSTAAGMVEIYKGLNNTLSVKGYAVLGVNAGTLLNGAGNPCIESTLADATFTTGEAVAEGQESNCAAIADLSDAETPAVAATNSTAWIITEDNLAYAVVKGTHAATENCLTKQQIAATASNAAAMAASCAVVYVDVNGLSKGPNTFETQGLAAALADDNGMDTLTGDRYKIYVGVDGATAGPRVATATGRMAADVK